MEDENPGPIQLLPVEILLSIFSFLRIDDLIALSGMSKRLSEGVLADPRINFDRSEIFMKHFNGRGCILDRGIQYIILGVVNHILRFLRIFNVRVKHIIVSLHDSKEGQVSIFFAYLNRYCFKLEAIFIKDLNFGVGRVLKRPFENLRVLKFEKSLISSRLNNFTKWFPNVQDISLYEINMIEDFSLILTKYKCLTIYSKTTLKFPEAEACVGCLSLSLIPSLPPCHLASHFVSHEIRVETADNIEKKDQRPEEKRIDQCILLLCREIPDICLSFIFLLLTFLGAIRLSLLVKTNFAVSFLVALCHDAILASFLFCLSTSKVVLLS